MDRTGKPLSIATVANQQHSLQHSIPGEVFRTTPISEPQSWEQVELTQAEISEYTSAAIFGAKQQAYKALETSYNSAFEYFCRQQEMGFRSPDEVFVGPELPESAHDIVLTEYESQQAIQFAITRAKKAKFNQQAREKYWNQINQELQKPNFTAQELDTFIKSVRAPELNVEIIHNEYSAVLYDALLHYHTGDQEKFIQALRYFDVEQDGRISNPFCMRPDKLSVDKGIALLGKPGTGKSTLMRLFARNAAMSYYQTRARHFETIYNEDGEPALRPFYGLISAKGRPIYWLNQNYLGLCIDDVGTEEIGLKFSRCETVATVLVERYERYFVTDNPLPFYATHFTSNLSLTQLKERYGSRFHDRLKEAYNVLFFPSNAPSRR